MGAWSFVERRVWRIKERGYDLRHVARVESGQPRHRLEDDPRPGARRPDGRDLRRPLTPPHRGFQRTRGVPSQRGRRKPSDAEPRNGIEREAAAPTVGVVSRRGAPPAAIFDLDRTLIAGASGPVFAEHLRAAGIEQRSAPRRRARRADVPMLGETATTAQIARLAARATAGWPVDAVAAAAEAAADALVEQVQPYAPGVIEEHRERAACS